MHHTIVISDIHLSEVEPGTGPWMRYRQRPFLPDGEIARVLDALCVQTTNGRATVVFNGDVFDFDAPHVVGRTSVSHDLPRDAEHGVPALAAILDDHPLFVAAVARVLAAGHEVVFVSGNHDVLLTLPEVRSLLSTRLVHATLDAESTSSPERRVSIEARIHFRAWFHRTNDGILVEHGHLYDPYCSYRYPMAPYKPERREIVATLGSVGSRLLVSRLGFFNPHEESSFMLTKTGYFLHWLRHWLPSRRSLALIWAQATGRILWSLFRARLAPCRRRFRENLRACMRETGGSLLAIGRHMRLFEPPAEERLVRVVRELWVDRAIVLLLGALLAFVCIARSRLPTALAFALVPLALLALYERLAPKPPLSETWHRVGRAMRRIAAIHRTRAVVFGHTHLPEGTWEGGLFLGNSGSWSAAPSGEDDAPSPRERPLIWLTSGDDGELFGGLFAWKNGTLEPRAVRERPRPNDKERPNEKETNTSMARPHPLAKPAETSEDRS